jgi:hypothetical protein
MVRVTYLFVFIFQLFIAYGAIEAPIKFTNKLYHDLLTEEVIKYGNDSMVYFIKISLN